MTLLLLHILAASIWTGGHLVLALGVLPGALAKRDVSRIQAYEASFERVGIAALVVQVVTGLLLAARLLGPAVRWIDVESSLARGVLLKLALLVATIALAAHARLRIIPTLSAKTLTALAWHIVLVTLIGVAFVALGVSLRFGGV